MEQWAEIRRRVFPSITMTCPSRNPIGQIKKSRQPRAFRSAELGDRHKIVRPADHRADGNHNQIDQRISDLTTTKIGEFGEVILNSSRLRRGHDMGFGARYLTTPLLLLSKRQKCRCPNYAKSSSMAQLPWIARLSVCVAA